MTELLFLIPIALFMGGLALAAFVWTVKSGQYEDMKGESWRIFMDDDYSDEIPQENARKRKPKKN